MAGHPSTNCDYNPTSSDVATCFWIGEVCPHQVKNAVVSYECVEGGGAGATGGGVAVHAVVTMIFTAIIGGLMMVV